MQNIITRLQRDANGITIGDNAGLYPANSCHVNFTSTGGVFTTALDTGVACIEVAATQDCFFQYGSVIMNAGDGFYVKGGGQPIRYAIRDLSAQTKAKISVRGAVGGTNGTFHLIQFK